MTDDLVLRPSTDPPRYSMLLRTIIIAISGVATLTALTDLPGAFYDFNHQTNLLKFAQAVTSVHLVLAPFIAGVALVFALIGRLPYAIISLAALSLVGWLADLPSVAIHGTEFSADIGGLVVIASRVVAPLAALAAIRFAWRGEHLGFAAFLACLPMVLSWAGAAAFAISVAMHGF